MHLEGDVERELRRRAKAVLRKRARGLRAAIPKDGIAARSRRIVEAVAALDAVKAARAVALFDPIVERNEVDLRELDALLRAGGKAVFYPSIEDEPPDEEPRPRKMTFRHVPDLESMQERGLGFRDPGPDAPEAERLDVIVVPGLAFDGRGHRLGYGAGYYDRALPRFRPPALAVGVAFAFQLCADLPSTEGDVPVNLVVTDERTLSIG